MLSKKSKNKICIAIISACILTLITTVGIYAFFPCKYRDEVIKTCNNTPIAPDLAFAVIRCESSFDKDKVSKKGAVGLMQIMPTTGEYISQLYFGGINFDLYSPNDNLLLGVTYLSYLLEKFKDLKTALASYNAGEGRVLNWLSQKDFSLDGKKLTSIPFKETESYVNKVLLYRKFYKFLWL